MNIAKIARGSMTDGPGGPRTVVWLQGCSIRCPGCQNWALWPKETSDMMNMSPDDAADLVRDIARGQPLTITGGEPFDQPEDLARFLGLLHDDYHIILYTGRTLTDLVRLSQSEAGAGLVGLAVTLALGYIDVLVDGPYRQELDNAYLQWRGSSNQRAIDMPATIQAHIKGGHGWFNPGLAVTLDWDRPTVEIIGGVAYATGGLFGDLGLDPDPIPRCGEFER